MKLLTKQLEALFVETGSQDGVSDPLVIAKFFNPTGAGTWWATEYNPNEKVFYDYVSIYGDECDEWGYFSLDELQNFRGRMGLGIERDLHCGIRPISEFKIPTLRLYKLPSETTMIQLMIWSSEQVKNPTNKK